MTTTNGLPKASRRAMWRYPVLLAALVVGVGSLQDSQAAPPTWIDLGQEGRTLWLTAAITLPPAGESREVVLATATGLPRVRAGVDAEGRYRLWVYDHAAVGGSCEPGETVRVVVRIRSHARAADDVAFAVFPADEDLPAEPPESEAAWTIVNRRGRSDANLARALVSPADAVEAVTRVRVAGSWEELASSPVLEAEGSDVYQGAPPSDLTPPSPERNPTSGLMLRLAEGQTDPATIDFAGLPRLPSRHAVVSDVRDRDGTWVHQHVYLARHAGRFWLMWSDGPGVRRPGVPAGEHRNLVPGHDQADTRVSFATSRDGLRWSEPTDLSGPPRKEGFGWIARGFWQRDGELLALASHFQAPGYAGPGLSLEAFRWTEQEGRWAALGTMLDDSLNNFPPKRLPGGSWMMSRRDGRRHVTVAVGGVQGFDQWTIRPLARYEGRYRPEEPYWYVLPDGATLVGLFRDNAGSKRLLRAFSRDDGRTWTPLVRTNFPDATSKFYALRTSRGFYVLVSNANPKQRDPMVLSVSRDGLAYTRMLYLVGGRHVDYPHVIEHEGRLLIALSGAKQTAEVFVVELDEIEKSLAGD